MLRLSLCIRFLLSLCMHGKCIHIVMIQIFMDTTLIRFGKNRLTVLFERSLWTESTRSADTAALTDHTLDKVFRQSADLHQKQCLLTLCGTVTLVDGRCDLIIAFFQTLQNFLASVKIASLEELMCQTFPLHLLMLLHTFEVHKSWLINYINFYVSYHFYKL